MDATESAEQETRFSFNIDPNIPLDSEPDNLIQYAVTQRETYMKEVYNKCEATLEHEIPRDISYGDKRQASYMLVEQNLFNPRIYEKQGEYYLGTASIETDDPDIDLRNPELQTLYDITREIREAFHKDIDVRVLFREPTTYEKEKRGIPFEANKRIAYLFIRKYKNNAD